MFTKPFKIKSNYQLKGTERKKLWEQILAAYPTLSDEEIQSVLPKKESISIMKVVTHDGHTGMVYCVAKIPMFFHLYLDSDVTVLSPTIYTLWHHPRLLRAFTTRTPVVSKLMGGADLMLPGVVLKEPVTLYSFGKLPKGTLVSVNTEENKAPVAVGFTALSSEDMYLAAGHGRCVKVLHVIGDTLCQIDPKSPSRPDLGPPDADGPANSSQKVETDSSKSHVEQTEALSVELQSRLDLAENSNDAKDEIVSEEHVEETESVETKDLLEESVTVEPEVPDPVQEMDRLLEYSFLKACKIIKCNDLPMLSSNFFKNHLLAACPPGKNIDVKKSRYKKLSVFLADMKAQGIINTSITKGVETLLSIKFDHPLVKELVITEEASVRTTEPAVSNSAVVSECYKVTADVLPVLSKFGYEKGDVMKRADIRKCFTEYVKSEDLQDGKTLKLNPQLAGIMRTKAHQETVTMEDGINKFIGRMTHMHEITVAGNTLLHTGKLEPIDMRVTVRSNGKKVTLVNNLETFGINPREFSKECQSIGASATITDDPGKKTPSVLVQGNQILYVYKLLTERYQIKKSYIRGLEFAPKKKK